MTKQTVKQEQQLVNKINAKQDFTYSITGVNKRYVIGVKTLFMGKNPSLQYNLIYDDIYNLDNRFDSVGGWLDTETGIYYVDYSVQMDDLFDAMQLARENNELAIYDTVENTEIKLIN